LTAEPERAVITLNDDTALIDHVKPAMLVIGGREAEDGGHRGHSGEHQRATKVISTAFVDTQHGIEAFDDRRPTVFLPESKP